MSRVWLLRAPEAPVADAAWEWLDASVPGAEVVRDALPAFAEALAANAARRQPVALLLPAARVLTAPLAVPLRQQRQLQQALPFLLEENLAADIERLHVVAGRRIDPTRLQAVAVDRDYLRQVLAALSAHGIDPDLVTAEALALAVPATGATLLLDGHDSLLAAADGVTLAFDAADAAVVGEGIAGGGGQIRLLPAQDTAAVAAGSLEAMFAAGDDAPRVDVADAPRHRLQWFAADDVVLAAPNLRQGEFARAGGAGFSLGFDWRPLAWLAASWAVLALGYQVAIGVSHARATAAVRDAQVELYRQVFPGSANVPQPRAQMEGRLRSQSANGAGFVAVMAGTAGTLASLDADGQRYTPRTIAWDGAHGQLRVDIVARSLEDLDQLRRALEQAGLAVDLGAGVAQDGGYKARMNITAAPGASS